MERSAESFRELIGLEVGWTGPTGPTGSPYPNMYVSPLRICGSLSHIILVAIKEVKDLQSLPFARNVVDFNGYFFIPEGREDGVSLY
jgi:hypothetical protein